MTCRFALAGSVLALILCLAPCAHAHRAWMLPSSTVLSATDAWVTVDAAISNDLFYFDHNPMRLDGLAITAPDGSPVKAENAATGKFRSTFDVPLRQPGTYKVAVVSETVAAQYEVGGEVKRWRGPAAAFTSEVPADAKNLQVARTHSRTEVFVTAGKPTDTVFRPTGVGIELVPITHPNDLVQGEPASFRLLRDGAPLRDLAVSVIPGGIRYRDTLREIAVRTDGEGAFTVRFPDAGMYWLSASMRTGGAPSPAGEHAGVAMPPAASSGASAASGPPPFRPGARVLYGVTLEVMAK